MKFLSERLRFKFASTPVKYDQVQGDEAAEEECSISSLDGTGRISKSETAARQKFCLFSFLALQSITISLLVIYVIINRTPSDLACARRLSPYSPFLETGDLQYEEFTDKNHLMQPSIYRGHPTPEIEQAWIDLWRLPTIRFPENKLEALNKSPPSLYAHVAPEYGEGVMGFLDVFHQLHCLSTVRQYTYREEYNYSNVTAFRAPDEVVRGHIDHCIETIRKAIMCASDVTPMVFIADPSRPEGRKSDFNIRRKCRNYQKVQEWAMRNVGF